MTDPAGFTEKRTKTPALSIFSQKSRVFLTAAAILVALSLTFSGCTDESGGSQQTNGSSQSQPLGGQSQAPSQTAGTRKISAGVTVNGIDISGMTKEEALAATAKIPETLLAKVAVSVTADGVNQRYTAADLSVSTDYETVIAQAIAYGLGESSGAQSAAAKAFTARATARKEAVVTALQPLKAKIDKAPADASYQFMPSGFTADGKAYQPDARKLADAHAAGKSLERPALVHIDTADTPSALRYQYWQTDRYIKNYIPADAAIARFRYTAEASGRVLDTDALAAQIVAQVDSGTYSEITAASKAAEPAVKVSNLKKETMLIASWTSSYRAHSSSARNWNVSRMSSFINGAVIAPGETWSVNKAAGPRNAQTAKTVGWREASGILNGGYTDQEGGGVCQLGSTTFNAAIRAGITIASSTHHTIPSDYIPLGLDATLSTPSPDLLLKNDASKTVYIVSYVNPKDKNVTVEVYGPQPIDPTYGAVIYDYTSNNKGTRYGSPTVKMVYNATVTPDKKVLSAAYPVHVYAKPRLGTQIQTYKNIYSLDGKALCDPIPFENHKYPVINGTTYVFGPAATPTPKTTASPTPTGTAAP